MQPQRILLTGASGFVGSRLGRTLLESFPDLDLLAVGGHENAAVPGARNTRSMLASQAEVDGLVANNPDVILHLGARSSVAASTGDRAETMSSNLESVLRLANAARRQAPECLFIFASSAEVYGASFLGGPVDETAPMQPANTYARSKAAAEMALIDMLAKTSRLANLRLFNHTGPGQDERFVVPSFAAQVARMEAGKAPPVMRVGNLSAIRDFLHVNDVIEAYLGIIRKAEALPTGVSTFNICSSSGHPIQDVVDGLQRRARIPFTIEVDPARLRPSDIPVGLGRGDRFASAFGWSPKISFDEILGSVLDFWRALERGETGTV